MLVEVGHAVWTAFFPGVSLQRYSSWRLGKRITSAFLLFLLLLGVTPRPAAAQTVDWAAFGQRAAEFGKTAYREIKQDVQWLKQNFTTDYWGVRQAMASYEDYRNAREIYQRVTNPNTMFNIVQGLPTLEVYGQNANGDEDVYVLRPVLRPQQRLNPPKLPGIQLPDFQGILNAIQSGQLDFDLDHSTFHMKSPDADLSEQAIAKVAIEDAWGNWRKAQEMQGASIDENYYDIPFDARTYDGLEVEAATHFNRRRQDLRKAAEFLSTRAESDPAYRQALTTLAEVETAMAAGKDKAMAAEVKSRLLKLDGQATQVVATAARLREALGSVSKRQANKDINVKALRRTYASPNSDVMSFTNWFNALGTDKKDANKEQLSASMLANLHAEDASLNATERMKQELITQLEEQNHKFRELAGEKARALSEMRSAMGDAWYADQNRLLTLQIQQDTAMARLRLLLARNPSPTGVPVNVPDQLATIPGTARMGTPVRPAAEVIAEQFPDKLQARISMVKSAMERDPSLQTGILQPLFRAIDAGAKSALGKSFNLTKWGGV